MLGLGRCFWWVYLDIFAWWGLLCWFCINLDCSVKFGLLCHGLLDRILPSQVCMVSFTGLCLVCRNLYVLFAESGGLGVQSPVLLEQF